MKPETDATADIARLRALIADSEFDAVIAASPENVHYVADVEIASQRTIRDRLAYIVLAKGQDPTFIVCQVEEGYVRQESWITDIRPFKEFVTKPTALLGEVLREKGLSRGRVAIDSTTSPEVTSTPCAPTFLRSRFRAPNRCSSARA